MSRETRTLEIRGRRFALGPRAWLMGIVNVTPDSFSDGGLYFDPGQAVDRGLELVADGADIVDVGGESTRPGSRPVPEAEELRPRRPGHRGPAQADAGPPLRRHDQGRRGPSRPRRRGRHRQRHERLPLRPGHGRRRGPVRRGRRPDAHAGHAADDAGRPRATTTSSARSAPSSPTGSASPRPPASRAERIIVDPGIGFGKIVRAQPRAPAPPGGLPRARPAAPRRLLAQGVPRPHPRPAARTRGSRGRSPRPSFRSSAAPTSCRVHDVGPVARAVRAAEAILGRRRCRRRPAADAREGRPCSLRSGRSSARSRSSTSSTSCSSPS